MSIFEKLAAIGVPVHPLGNKSKIPINEGWQKNPNMIMTAPESCNVGIRTGATIGMKNRDKFICVIDDDVPSEASMKSMWRLFNGKQLIEKSGGHHNGLHHIFTSHLPFPSCDRSENFPELYCLNKDFNFKNVCIAPSEVVTRYKVHNREKRTYLSDDDTIIAGWQRIIDETITETKWLEIMRKIVKPADLDETVFIYSLIPLIVSEDFNYKFFGQILSAMALRANFPIPTLNKWTLKLLKLLPTGLRDDKTIKQILQYQIDTPNRKTSEDSIPGIPTFKTMIEMAIKEQRGYKIGPLEFNSELDQSVQFYVDIITGIFAPIQNDSLDSTPGIVGSGISNIKSRHIISPVATKLYFDTEKYTYDTVPNKELCIEEGFLSCGNVSMIFGEEGSFKSWGSSDMIAAATNGESCWGGRYTFKHPTKTMLIYGDKTRKNHENSYLNRYTRKINMDNFKCIYPLNIWKDLYSHGSEGFIFDLADETSLKFIEDGIKQLGTELVIIDNMSSCILGGDFSDGKFARKWMPRVRKIAGDNKCSIILLHHSNKLTTKETRGKPVTKDDYQGSKIWSALSDWTIAVYNKPAEKEGCVRIGKYGILSEFENFDYKIINNKWQDTDGAEHHTVDLEFLPPETDVNLKTSESINAESQKQTILSKLINGPLLSINLRTKLGIGKSSNITPSVYKRRLSSLILDGYVTMSGATHTVTYTITEKGKSLLSEGTNA